jgi:D-glycero-alpha-D-manno-heptose-7-phosphate kinase
MFSPALASAATTQAGERPFFTLCRTPLRVSLFGGGTDYPEWFQRQPGAVLGFTIDKYIYMSALRLSSFVEYRFRFSYSQTELVETPEDVSHPVMRAVLLREDYREPLDCSIQADLPASAGLGSSSAFTVGFTNLVSALKGVSRSKLELARLAIATEQTLLNERVGVQDQLHAAFGGINRFNFEGDKISIEPLQIDAADVDTLSSWMMLVYTGLKRNASEVLCEQLENTTARRVDAELSRMVQLVGAAQSILEGMHGDDLPRELARLLCEGWQLKKSLSNRVTTPAIEELYEACLRHGALAGKLCGAGGGGFLLMIVPPDARPGFTEAIGADRCVPFKIEQYGSAIRECW